MSRDGVSPPTREDLTPDQARLLPFYHDLRNDIVEPDKVVVTTQYFWAKWAPRLGPTLTALVVCLRRHCYYNRATQERRDWCFPEQATLAREIGVETTKTIRAALSDPLASHFVRREARYVYDPARGKKVRTSDMYYVAMDDPLTPDDEALLALRAAERLLAEGRGAEVASPGTIRRSNGQNDRQVSRRSTGRKAPQVASPGGQLARQDSPAFFTPEVVHEESTCTMKYAHELERALRVLGAANRAPITLAQSARLEALCRQFDEPARRHDPSSSGASWVLAAIGEAVESGSHFVAPRRIARICERWSAEGGPGPGAVIERESSPVASHLPPVLTGEGEGEGVLRSNDRDSARNEEGTPLTLTLSREDRGEDTLRPGAPTFPELGLPSRAVWQAVCDEARRRLSSPGDVALLRGSQLVGRETHLLIIGVPGRSAAQRAQARLTRTLGDVTRVVLGRSYEPRFVSLGEWSASQQPPAEPGVRAGVDPDE